MRIALVAAPFFLAHVLGAQVITTIAGTSWSFPSGTLSVLNAPLGEVSGAVIDSRGNLFVADPTNFLIVEISPRGTLTVVAGNGKQGHSGDGGPAVNASINPSDITLDSKGNLYIQDQSYVRMVTSAGIISTIAGNGAFGFSGDGGPATNASINALSGIVTDSAGAVYFADTFNNRIRKIANGVITTIAGNGSAGGFAGDGGQAAAAQLNSPSGLAFDSFGTTLYVSDSANHRVREISTVGIISTLAGPSPFAYPANLALDMEGNLYIADTDANQVFQYSVNSKTLSVFAGAAAASGAFAGDGGSATQARLNSPAGLTVDPAGNLYIADSGNYRVREVAASKISTLAGSGLFRYAGDGGQAINAQLNFPAGMALDSAGTLYFADSANNRVRKVTSAGMITTVAGNGLAAYKGDNGNPINASLNNPTDVALDGGGNLYIADAGNSVVRKIVLATGVITTVAGGGMSSAEGVMAMTANLISPVAVAVDASGNLYIAERDFNKVAIVTNDGKINTFVGQASGFPGYAPDGSAAFGAPLRSPEGLAFDNGGNLYIAETGNNVIRKVTTAGSTPIISTVAGNRTTIPGPDDVSALSSGVVQPNAVSVDAKGNLFIAEFDGKIRQVGTNGIIQSVAGGGATAVLGDGGSPTAAGIATPQGVLIDSSSNIIVADTGNGRIRKVIGNVTPGGPLPPPQALPAWQISTAAMTFTQTIGGTNVPPQIIGLMPTVNGSTPAVNGLNFSAAVDSSCQSWLSLNIYAGNMPASIQVIVDPTNLQPGAYACTITITAPNTVAPTAAVAVKLTVPQPPLQPSLGIDTQSDPLHPNPISFTAALNSAPLTSQFHVLNIGGGSLSYNATVTSSGGAWLSVQPASGSATPNGPVGVTVTATPTSLSPGAYTGSVVVTGGATTFTIPVNLTISGPSANMLLSEAAITFNAVAQGGLPLPHNFGILNTGSGAMDWQASASTLVNGSLTNGAWLTVSPSSGTVQRPFLDVSQVSVTIDPTNLQGGQTYYGRITITSSAAVNNPQLITVIVNVLPAGVNPGPQIFPTGLIFTGVAGVDPGSQDVRVANPSNSANSFQSGIIGTGFSFLPLNASLGSAQLATLHVYPDFSNVTPGSQQHGTITLQFSDGSPSQTVGVLIVVAPPGVTPNNGDANTQAEGRDIMPRASGSCASQPLQLQYRSLPSPFSATVGQGTTIDVTVSDGCGNLIGPSGQTAQTAKVTALFSNADTVAMTHIGNGVWEGAWKPTATGTFTMFVDASVPVGSTLVGGQTKALTANVTVVPSIAPKATATPLTSSVTQSASQAAGRPIAPGELISVYGANLATETSTSSVLPLPTQANGLQVLLGLTPLPILYTSSGQMNVQVPYSIPLNTQYQLSVVTQTGLSVPQTLTVAPAQPGIFTSNGEGTGQGSIVKSDGVTLAQAGTPAAIGETITIYCTGLGIVSPAVVEGVAPTTSSRTVDPVTVTIGGVNAPVAYSGVTPGLPGMNQVNAIVPSGIATGDSVPVQITIAGQSSQIITMSVR